MDYIFNELFLYLFYSNFMSEHAYVTFDPLTYKLFPIFYQKPTLNLMIKASLGTKISKIVGI